MVGLSIAKDSISDPVILQDFKKKSLHYLVSESLE